jgi:hypothetical protein
LPNALQKKSRTKSSSIIINKKLIAIIIAKIYWIFDFSEIKQQTLIFFYKIHNIIADK